LGGVRFEIVANLELLQNIDWDFLLKKFWVKGVAVHGYNFHTAPRTGPPCLVPDQFPLSSDIIVGAQIGPTVPSFLMMQAARPRVMLIGLQRGSKLPKSRSAQF